MVFLILFFSAKRVAAWDACDLFAPLSSLTDEHMIVQLVPHVGKRKGTNKADSVISFIQEAK